ncbi:MAG: hypothetical protein K2V38_24770, partial [Gemmataceae bacterium]|nr:hypothetical protein [Gemmataceae bacterium]
CCKAAWVQTPARPAHAARTPTPPSTPTSPDEACCVKPKKAKTCCGESSPSDSRPTPTSNNQPKHHHSPECACCAERPDAAPPETLVELAPEPSGAWLSLEKCERAVLPEHRGPFRGGNTHGPPEGLRGVKYTSLFERHALRC